MSRADGLSGAQSDLFPSRLASENVAITEAISMLSETVRNARSIPATGLRQLPGRINRTGMCQERRIVSVLFADLVGFTSLVDDLTPVEVGSLQTDWMAVASGAVQRHGGYVEQYVGDAIMAVFDPPATTEQAAADAVRAGLELQRQLDGRALAGRWSVRARVGIATGECIVDEAGISGSVISSAARIQAFCPHGAVLVDEPTQRAAMASVRCQEMPPIRLAGRSRPVDVWLAISATGHASPANEELLAQLDQLMQTVTDELTMMAAEVTAAGNLEPGLQRRCLRAADILARRMEQLWQAVSDFRGTDLAAAALESADLEDLDGVYWSDDTAPGSATRWPESVRSEIVANSRPYSEFGPGVFVVQWGATIGVER
jgi:class 3 adenylate cyclase